MPTATLSKTEIKEVNLFNRLKSALVEKDVEDIYREVLRIAIPKSTINSPFKSDGVLKNKAHDLIALLEFKLDCDFKKRSDVAMVLTQALFYLKKFESAGERLPSILFIGDVNECFCMHSNEMLKYLDTENVNWNVAPSEAHKHNPELTLSIHNDDNISPYVFDINKNFKFSDVVNKMLDLNQGIVRLVRITEKNITTIFDYFCKNVIKKQKDFSTNALVGMFLQLLINPTENYLHPTKKNTLVTKSEGEVKVDGKKFISFFSHFEKDYKPSEKEKLTEIADRLLEDEKRRRDGAFFTPTLWVDEGHKEISKALGEDWRDEYVVWDCACGTGNLTRDYRFKELYCSTLNKEEIEIMKQGGISDDAQERFAYDFLNTEDLEDLPQGLADAITSGKKVLFFINPPYGRAGTSDVKNMASTMVSSMMKENRLGQGSSNLYTQFLYKIAKLQEKYGNITIALYSPTLFLTGGSFEKFRKLFLNNFKMDYGMVFQASHFADVSAQWGIMFSIWTQGQQGTNPFNVEVKDDILDLD